MRKATQQASPATTNQGMAESGQRKRTRTAAKAHAAPLTLGSRSPAERHHALVEGANGRGSRDRAPKRAAPVEAAPVEAAIGGAAALGDGGYFPFGVARLNRIEPICPEEVEEPPEDRRTCRHQELERPARRQVHVA
jgi:hypothetical protein